VRNNRDHGSIIKEATINRRLVSVLVSAEGGGHRIDSGCEELTYYQKKKYGITILNKGRR
jgi:hypothetical protein